MFFCAFLGAREHEPSWRETVGRHAAWLGLTAHLDSRAIADGRVFSFGWVSLDPPKRASLIQDADDRLIISTLEAKPSLDADLASRTGFEPGVTLLQVSLQDGELLVMVPPAPTEKFFFAHTRSGYAFSTDLRLLLRWAGIELHALGVYAVFEQETTPWTLTLSRTVQQVPLGHRWRLPAGDGAPALEAFFRWPETHPSPAGSSPEVRTRETLDRIVAEAEHGAAISFSGDTDSATLAARLAALGRTDVTLVHLARSGEHPRAQRARQMAEHLHMPFELVVWRPEDTACLLARLGREYSFPFGDMAVIPTLVLVHAVSAHRPRPPMLLDGSGVEINNPGAMHHEKWRRIYRIPRIIRYAIGETFRLGLWKSSSKPARFADAMRTSLQMPLARIDYYGRTYATGIAYTVPPAIREELEAIAHARLDALQAGLSVLQRASISRMEGLGLTVARSFDPLRVRGIRPLYPYLRPEMLRLCAELSYEEMNPDGQAKGLLKRILAENVPREWIEQPREGFPTPYEDAFAHPASVEFFNDVVLVSGNPLLDYCHLKRVRQMARRIQNHQPVSGGVRRFLWTLTFASAWLQQLQAAL